ncbi:MAG: hypothetical protein KIS92_07565 [Planctomycetota bacterium]|nr:hypothetical protein [Planctomycetota bacterium]
MRSSVLAIVLVSALAARAEEPAPKPANPFAPREEAANPDARPGTLELSDGTKRTGTISMTLGAKVELFVEKTKEFRQYALKDLSRIAFEIEQETEEKEWRWKEGGSDEKIYTGRSYFDRKYRMKVTLADGKTVVAGHSKGAPIFVKTPGQDYRYILRHDQRGEYGQKAAEIVYVKSVVFDPPADGKK